MCQIPPITCLRLMSCNMISLVVSLSSSKSIMLDSVVWLLFDVPFAIIKGKIKLSDVVNLRCYVLLPWYYMSSVVVTNYCDLEKESCNAKQTLF